MRSWLIVATTLMAAFAAAAQEVEVDPGEGFEEPAPAKRTEEPGREPVCTLTEEATQKAVDAFSRMMPALSHPRCANCHGGVNPFIENGGHAGGQIKIGNFAERWLSDGGALKDALSAGGRSPGPDAIKNAQTALRTILSADGPLAPEVIAELLAAGDLEEAVAANACSSCHAHQPIAWRLAKSPFAGRSQKELCEAFQKHAEVTRPSEFVEHMSRDPLEFIPVAFAGTRGLTPFGQAIYKEVRGKSYAPEPMPMSRIALNRAAFDWASVLGADYRRPASCGCEKLSYELAIDAAFDIDYAGSGGVGEVKQRHSFRLPMTFTQEGKFDANGVTTFDTGVFAASEGGECRISQPTEETWALKGSIDPDTREMKLGGVVTTRSKPAEVICRVDGKIIRQPVPTGESTEAIERYNFAMPGYIDETKEFSVPAPYGGLTLKVTVRKK